MAHVAHAATSPRDHVDVIVVKETTSPSRRYRPRHVVIVVVAVVLVAQSDKHLPDLIALVLALRISQPMAHVVVAGNIVREIAGVDTLVGADAVLPDLETAVDALGTIIDARP